MRFRKLICAVVFVAGLFTPVVAEDAPMFSGPQVGERLPALKMSLAYGEHAGEVVNVVDDAAGRPTLLVIVNGANRPAAGLTRALMNFAEMQGDRLYAAVVYLDGDLTAAEKYLRQAVAWWGVGLPVGVAVDGAEGPGAYGLNRNTNLTILIAHKGRVLANFALVQPSLTDGPGILTEVTRLVGGRVPTNAEMNFLSVPTQKLGDAAWQPAPADVELRRLMCDAIAAETEDQARDAATDIDEYVRDDSQRQAVLGRVAVSLLHRKSYTELRGVPIVEHLQRWRIEYGKERPNRRRADN